MFSIWGNLGKRICVREIVCRLRIYAACIQACRSGDISGSATMFVVLKVMVVGGWYLVVGDAGGGAMIETMVEVVVAEY